MTNDYEEIQKIRQKHGVSAADLARFLGIKYDRLQKWEQKKSAPKQEDAEKLKQWAAQIEAGEIRMLPKERPSDMMEVKAVCDALLNHYCVHVAPLLKKSALEVQREILDESRRTVRGR